MLNQDPRRPGVLRRYLRYLVLLCLAAAFCAASADDKSPIIKEALPGNAAPADQEPKCVHGCQRWGKVCNVDPRGVYKCRRRCEKFGEICE